MWVNYLIITRNSMRKIITIVLFLNVLAGMCPLHAQNDHLRPVNGPFDMLTFQFEYYSKIRKVLFKGLPDYPEISFLVKPSFSPENVLIIEYDRENEKYYIVYHTCEERIWENVNWQKVKVSKYRREVSRSSVELIKSLFNKAISQISYPESEDYRPDKTTYFFSVLASVQKSGKIESPDNEAKMGRLVKIGYGLIELVKQKASIVELEPKFKAEIEKLTEELK
jgi:hypothetical protein